MGRVQAFSQPAHLSIRAIRANHYRRPQRLQTADGRDIQLDAIGGLSQTRNRLDLAQCDLSSGAAGGQALPQAVFVEALAHGHGTDGLPGPDPHLTGGLGPGGRRRGVRGRIPLLQHDLPANPLHHRIDRIAQRLQSLAGEPAGTRLGPGEGAPVEQQDTNARARQIEGRGAAGRTSADDDNIRFERHSQLPV